MWFYAKDGEQHGPVEAEDIRSRLQSGDLSNGTLVWREGMAQWSPLGEVLELRDPVPASTEEGPESAEREDAATNIAPVSPAPSAAPVVTQMSQPAPQLVAPGAAEHDGADQYDSWDCEFLLRGIFDGNSSHYLRSYRTEAISRFPHSAIRRRDGHYGLILGYIITVLSILTVIAYVAFFVFAINAAPTSFPATPTPAPTLAP